MPRGGYPGGPKPAGGVPPVPAAFRGPKPAERQVLLLTAEGGVLFHSPRCRISDNGDGTLKLVDLCEGPPAWVRAAEAAVRPYNDGEIDV